MEAPDTKREQIIEAALKRFAHFGMGKTTMTESAKDLNLSKALLYYYFPDKTGLYATVLDRLFSFGDREFARQLKKVKTSEEGIATYIDLRHSFIEKYYTLLEPSNFTELENHPDLIKLFEKAREQEKKHFTEIIKIDITRRASHVSDPEAMAELLFEAILGLRMLLIKNLKSHFKLDKEILARIADRQKQFAFIFLKGLNA
jgi:TetR/AcrR family transcriptional regulator